jgi:tRNA-uridine 2-sulfurtransferase
VGKIAMVENEGNHSRVVVAMSGGVDSSVAAALLLKQGYEVIGMMLHLWSEPGKEATNRCCTPDAMASARRVANQLGIAFYPIEAQDIFRQTIVEYFLDGYAKGTTPNPCLLCNRKIRWGFMMDRARALGADYLATGHYARLQQDPTGQVHLFKAADPEKDQSYVLYSLNQDQLSSTLFPLGEYTKPEVRKLAHEIGLPVADRPESQDLCFLGNVDYRNFLTRHLPEIVKPGPIMHRDGSILGQHSGLAFYTIGQRKGLGISNPSPVYVIDKDILDNILIVGSIKELGRTIFNVDNIRWISGTPLQANLRVSVKIRYKSTEVGADIYPTGEKAAQLVLDQPVLGVTPGQAAVFYKGDECLGGGIILPEVS